MTCEEAQAIVERTSENGGRGPEDATRAERVAVSRHLHSCPDCWEFVRRRAWECLMRLAEAGTPLTREDIEQLHKEAADLDDADAFDPEAQ